MSFRGHRHSDNDQPWYITVPYLDSTIGEYVFVLMSVRSILRGPSTCLESSLTSHFIFFFIHFYGQLLAIIKKKAIITLDPITSALLPYYALVYYCLALISVSPLFLLLFHDHDFKPLIPLWRSLMGVHAFLT